MKKRKLLTLLISICLILSLAAIPFMSACGDDVEPPDGEQEEEEEEEEEEEPMTLQIGSLIGLTGGSGSIIFGIGSIIIMPIVYGIAGALGGLICGFFYNIVAGMVGGIEIETN